MLVAGLGFSPAVGGPGGGGVARFSSCSSATRGVRTPGRRPWIVGTNGFAGEPLVLVLVGGHGRVDGVVLGERFFRGSGAVAVFPAVLALCGKGEDMPRENSRLGSSRAAAESSNVVPFLKAL